MTAAGVLLAEAANALKISGRQEAELNAELLLEHLTQKPRLYFRVNPDCDIPPEQLRRFKNLLKKRADGVPLAYLTGSQQFRGAEINVTTSVLIPRPETEELAGLALSAISCLGKAAPVILDLCTGSGCIACALAQELPDSRIIAADVSAAALRVARANAKKLGLERRITFRLSDMFETLRGQADCIVCNPPYVPSAELAGLEKELSFEPPLALDGGPDGLMQARRVTAGAPRHLHKGGRLLLELGIGQPQRLARELDPKIWDNIGIVKDLQGIERFLTARHI